jgi:hypothetical protein
MRLSVSLLRVGLCVMAVLLVFRPSALFSADSRDLARLRSTNPAIALLIAEADKRSLLFHKLVADLARTDGLVYVEAGWCGHGVRACVPHSIARAGPFRLLRILIDPYDAQHVGIAHLAGIIAHEMQHALELLADPRVTSAAAMFWFYEREAPAGGAFETAAAILVSDRVSREMANALRSQ